MLHGTHSAVHQPFHSYGGACNFGDSAESPDPSTFPTRWWGVFFFEVVLHLMSQLTLNLWWELNLVILVWWFGVRLMNLLTSGQWSISLLDHTSILVSQVRCQHNPPSTWTRLWGLVLVEPSSWILWAWSWFFPHKLCHQARTGCILWGWCHAFFSLFRLSPLDYYVSDISTLQLSSKHQISSIMVPG